MGPMRVVELGEVLDDVICVTQAEAVEVIQALTPQGGDQGLREGVGVWRHERCLDDLDAG